MKSKKNNYPTCVENDLNEMVNAINQFAQIYELAKQLGITEERFEELVTIADSAPESPIDGINTDYGIKDLKELKLLGHLLYFRYEPVLKSMFNK
jgi:hypothetical protein